MIIDIACNPVAQFAVFGLVPTHVHWILGGPTCDGIQFVGIFEPDHKLVNLLDVQSFVDLIASGTLQAEADINKDGDVNLLDVDLFIDLLAG